MNAETKPPEKKQRYNTGPSLRRGTCDARIELWLKQRKEEVLQRESKGLSVSEIARFTSHDIANDINMCHRRIGGILPQFSGIEHTPDRKHSRGYVYTFNDEPISKDKCNKGT